jgi:hypothetical protein
MALVTKPREGPLDAQEQSRLDDLLSAARGFHYTSIVIAGLSLVLSSIEETVPFALPIGGIQLPSIHSAVALYLLVIILSLAAERLAYLAEPSTRLDPRRPPFPWIALRQGPMDLTIVRLWLLAPILACAVATATSLEGDQVGSSLGFVGLVIIFMPRFIYKYTALITNRADERGGPATFSIYLLYLYRLFTDTLFMAYFFAPILAVIPRWRPSILPLTTSIIRIIAPIWVLRRIAGFGRVYRMIDRIGIKFGFPPDSPHYK